GQSLAHPLQVIGVVVAQPGAGITHGQPVRRAYGQAVTTLTVQLLKQHDPNDQTQLSVKETLTRLQSARSGAAY
ncbi:hypothetical protein RSW37_24755, partial [Escherichia coli]|uniref:hypothetical protein n=1 Tax=Escherichia coli TaxID=562 RepID=UPI0028E04AEE